MTGKGNDDRAKAIRFSPEGAAKMLARLHARSVDEGECRVWIGARGDNGYGITRGGLTGRRSPALHPPGDVGCGSRRAAVEPDRAALLRQPALPPSRAPVDWDDGRQQRRHGQQMDRSGPVRGWTGERARPTEAIGLQKNLSESCARCALPVGPTPPSRSTTTSASSPPGLPLPDAVGATSGSGARFLCPSGVAVRGAGAARGGDGDRRRTRGAAWASRRR